MKFILFVVFLLSKISLVFGEDLSTCAMKKTPDEQNYCKASFAGSGTFVKIQRNNAYQIKKYEPPKPEKE